MKKEYEVPKAEKLEFNYSEGVTASSSCGGAFQKYTDGGYNCQTTPTGEWSNPYSDVIDAAANGAI
ncbi:MAG: hypothetical protein IJK06_01645 [Clostridia bacterium]|nr:hypothetical protein [Clostridia bacterium]